MEIARTGMLLGLIVALLLLYLNRKELLTVIKEKESFVDGLTRKVVHLEEAYHQTVSAYQELEQNKLDLEQNLSKQLDVNSKILSQKKSSETRIGTIAENALPLLREIPYNPQNLRHLGMPIDFVYFDYDGADPGIIFIEVKSGNAKESQRQKLIKKFVKEGKIYYEELRINEKGITVKRAKNEGDDGGKTN